MGKTKITWAKIKALDYRHYICIAITFGFFGCGFIFHNALPRAAEAVRDLAISLAYYVCGIFVEENNPITPTVTQMPSWQFAPSRFEPLKLFPWTWEEFKVLWGEYWDKLFTMANMENYGYAISDVLYVLSKLLLVLMPFALLIVMYAKRYTSVVNNDRGVKSKALKRWERFVLRVLLPVKRWVQDFVAFILDSGVYKPLWIFLWVMYFNVATIVMSALAWYLYFIVSFDGISLYTQLLKLMVDLAPMVRFIPVAIWAVLGVCFFNYICRSRAMSELYHRENCNRGFLNERGVVTIVYGNMGVGKTSLLTSMALTEEANMRYKALEILLETDLKFPHFPWENLREEMKQRMERHELVDIPSVKRWLASWRRKYEYLEEQGLCSWWMHQVRKRKLEDVSFGYLFDRYETDYNDELKITRLYSALEDYACAYFVYTIETALIISNYSVREDAIREDLGNFPIWNHDFFDRDPRRMDAHSRYCHILDFDVLRLGKRMLENNPNRNAFGFGVYLVSEIDKERKNALALKETKINAEECNQRNDLFDSCLKMSRHACVIANRVFVKVICDLQRPEDWGAGGREVGEVVFIAKNGELAPAFPFCSPFWLCEGVFKWVKTRYEAFYVRYIHNRADNTLFVHFLKGIMSRLDSHYRKLNNKYGIQPLDLEVESGRMNGDPEKKMWYRMPKKDYAKRYSTNCLSAIFEGDEYNTISIADFKTYADIMATEDELLMQHSHFQNDVHKTKKAS